MLQQQITVINKLGLHARASAKLTQTAGGFQSEIWLSHQGRRVNAKSIMGVMMLAANQGTSLSVEIDGPDETAALHAIESLIDSRFGEDE